MPELPDIVVYLEALDQRVLALLVDGAGLAQKSTQLVIVGEMSGIGGEIGWQFRRAS